MPCAKHMMACVMHGITCHGCMAATRHACFQHVHALPCMCCASTAKLCNSLHACGTHATHAWLHKCSLATLSHACFAWHAMHGLQPCHVQSTCRHAYCCHATHGCYMAYSHAWLNSHGSCWQSSFISAENSCITAMLAAQIAVQAQPCLAA